MSTRQRDNSLDIAKAIGILLMILGHTTYSQHFLRQFIFSFHMPLFFLIGGYLYRPKGIKDSLKKDFIRLITPYFATCGVIIVYYTFLYTLNPNYANDIHYFMKASIWGSGTNHHCLLFADTPWIGAIWFLPALYVCKNTYNALQGINANKTLMISTVIFLAATVIGRYLIYLPFSILSGLSAIIFYAIGDRLKDFKKIKIQYWIIGIIFWMVSIKYSHIYIVQPILDLYLVDVIGATTASILVFLLSKQISKLQSLSSSLVWLGRNTIYILCFHLIDLDCYLSVKIARHSIDNHYIILFYRFLIPIIATIIFCLVKNWWNNRKANVE